LPAEVTAQDDNPTEIFTTENIASDEWVTKITW
jgi:hypothetical protein